MRARLLAAVILISAGVFFSLASGGPIMTGSNCCVCLDEEQCVPGDSNTCADQIGSQIGGEDTKVEVTSADCPGKCDDCEGFDFEVVEQ